MPIKKTLKYLCIFSLNIIYFMLISIPIATILYFTAHLFFESKRILKWIIN
jgi:hypothetical protein